MSEGELRPTGDAGAATATRAAPPAATASAPIPAGFLPSDPAAARSERRAGRASAAERLVAGVVGFYASAGVTDVVPVAAWLTPRWSDVLLWPRRGDLVRAEHLAGLLGRRLGGTSRGSRRGDGELVVSLQAVGRGFPDPPDPPCLVPLLDSPRRGTLYAAWDALDDVLVAGAEEAAVGAVTANLVAWLAALPPPDGLRFRVVAPRESPIVRAAGPGLVEHAEPRDAAGARRVLARAAAEVRRRRTGGTAPASSEVVVLADLDVLEMLPEPSCVSELALVKAHGRAVGVRLIAATTRPDLMSGSTLDCCPTRLVLRTADSYVGMRLVRDEYAHELEPGRMIVAVAGHQLGTGAAFTVDAAGLDRLAAPDGTPACDPAPARSRHPAPTRDPASAPEGADAPIEVICFGSPRVLCRGREIWPGSGVDGRLRHWELLLYLAARRELMVPKGEVLAALWPDSDDTGGLRSALTRLRDALRGAAGLPDAEIVRSSRWACALDRGFVASDVHRFVALCEAATDGEPARAVAAAREARALYRGVLLGDRPFGWLDARGPSGLTPAEEMASRHRRVTARLADLYAGGGRPDLAAPLYREVLAADPVDEAVVRRLARCLYRLGDAAAVAREEARLRQALRARFGAAADAAACQPEAKTSALFRELLQGTGDNPAA